MWLANRSNNLRFGIFFQINYLSAQEAAPAGPSGGPVLRLGFYEMLHQTYWTEEDNTFYQMTGTNRFRGGKGYQGIPSGDITDIQIPDGISANVNTKKSVDGNEHSKVDSAVGRITDWLPSFSLEYIIPTNYLVGAGLGFLQLYQPLERLRLLFPNQSLGF